VDERPRNPHKVMENTSQFDLNGSLSLWLARLAQSPHFRNENVAEMESHVRDSVTRLRSQGLSEEESFLIAIRRAGSVAKLEPEFAKVNRSWANLIIHGLILAFFSMGCFFLWGITRIPLMMAVEHAKLGALLPAFSQLIIRAAPWLIAPPLLATAYCVYVWVRPASSKSSWPGFFATAMAILFLLAIPILMAAFLPLINLIDHIPVESFQP